MVVFNKYVLKILKLKKDCYKVFGLDMMRKGCLVLIIYNV